jgi:hypothetical protein
MIKKQIIVFVVIAAVCFAMALEVRAEVKFKGFFQGWFSYAPQEGTDDDGLGFTLRRIRFKPYGNLGEKVSWTFQVGWDKASPALIDAYLDLNLSKQFMLRVGRFTVPGTVSSSLTSSSKLDLIERAMVTQQWSGNSGLSGYRGIGVQVHGNLANGKLYYAVMLANPRTGSLFNPSIKSPVYEHENNGISTWARLEAKPVKGLRIGAFYGSSKDDDDYVTNSYGAHVFYTKSGINFKAEYIAGKYGFEDMESKYNGFYAVLGYKFNKVEPIVRYDFYTPKEDFTDGAGVEKYNNISVGLTYFYSKHIKFQLNYIIRSEIMTSGLEELDNNLFYMCVQYTYD